MPQINNSTRLDKLFTPPEGYKLDYIEMTTYSLSMSFLSKIPLLMYIGDKRINTDKIYANRLYRKLLKEDYEKKFHIYYDGNIKRKPDESDEYLSIRGRYALALLRERCTPICEDNKLFHPKIIVLQFEKVDGSGEYFYRVHISSRNLTMAQYLEAGVTLVSEERSDEEEKCKAVAKPIADFFRDLQKSKNVDSKIKWDVFEKKYFVLENEEPDNPRNISVHFKDFLTNIKADIENEKDYSIRVTSMNPTNNLFSNAKSVEYICNFKDMYEYKDDADNNEWKIKEDKKESYYYVGQSDNQPKNLHIKQYIIHQNNNPKIIWIGSANCSKNGLNNGNTEVMVRIEEPASSDLKECSSQSKVITGRDYYYYQPETVQDPLISDFQDEELPSCKISVFNANYDGKSMELTLYVKSSNNTVEVCPVGINYYRKYVDERNSLQWKIEPQKVSNLLAAKVGGQEFVVPFDLNVTNVELPNSKSVLSGIIPEPIDTVADFIPNPEGHQKDDETYEKLLKWKLTADEKFNEVCKELKEELEFYKEFKNKYNDEITLLREWQVGTTDKDNKIFTIMSELGYDISACNDNKKNKIIANVRAKVLAVLDNEKLYCDIERLLKLIDYMGIDDYSVELPQKKGNASEIKLLSSKTKNVQVNSFSLSPLQESTLNHLLEIYKQKTGSGSTDNNNQQNLNKRMYVLADETGLGKTMVSAAFINKLAEKKSEKPLIVYYICNNQRVTSQNVNKLARYCNAEVPEEDRLSLYFDYKSTSDKPVILIPLTPGTTFKDNYSRFEQKEADRFAKALEKDDYKKEYEKLYKEAYKEDWQKRQLILKEAYFLNFRKMFCKLALQGNVKPDLVLLDEFQNYCDLLKDYDKEDEVFGAMIDAAGFTLMLSATPYEMRTNLIKNTRFEEAITGNIAKEGNGTEIEPLSFNELVRIVGDIEGYKKASDKSEYLYNNVLCRTERGMFYNTEQGDADLNNEQAEEYFVQIEAIKEEMSYIRKLSEIEQNKILNDESAPNQRIMYSKKAPHFTAFATRYTFGDTNTSKDENKSAKDNNTAKDTSYVEKYSDLLRKINKINPFSHAKLKALWDFAVQEEVPLMLWVPPVYEDDIQFSHTPKCNPFKKHRDFTKTLVFTTYRMENASVATLISAEVKRKQNEFISKCQGKNHGSLEDLDTQNLKRYYDQCLDVIPQLNGYLEELFSNNIELIQAVTGLEDQEKAKWLYAAMGSLQSVLKEYKYLGGDVEFWHADGTLVKYFPDHYNGDERLCCAMAERFTEDKGDDVSHSLNHTRMLQNSFNSPFYPFVIVASSVAQEGLDFDRYCHGIVHWSIPKTPIEYWQREGRVDRYKSHLTRKRLKNLCDKINSCDCHSVECAYEFINQYAEENGRIQKERLLFPNWYIGKCDAELFGIKNVEFPRLKRMISVYPMSKEEAFYNKLMEALQKYNSVIGPSYQPSGVESVQLCPYKRERANKNSKK